MSQLAAALIAQLDDDALAELALAARLAPFLPRPELAEGDRWLNTRQAAEYLGISLNALHKLTAARAIPFEQDRPGAKCWFRRSELDAWRRGGLTTVRT
jgi:excisionase family DNA binding protein